MVKTEALDSLNGLRTSHIFKDIRLNVRHVFLDLKTEYKYSSSLREAYVVESLVTEETAQTTMRGLCYLFKLSESTVSRMLRETGSFVCGDFKISRFAVKRNKKELVTKDYQNAKLLELQTRLSALNLEVAKIIEEIKSITA